MRPAQKKLLPESVNTELYWREPPSCLVALPMSVIWKYRLDVSDSTLELPQGAEIISANSRGQDVFVWAIVNPSAPKKSRRFVVLATGQEFDFPGTHVELIGSVFFRDTALVFHVFELIEIEHEPWRGVIP